MSPWVTPGLPELMTGPLDIDTLSDDSESEDEDPEARFHPTASMAKRLFYVNPADAAPAAAAAAPAPAPAAAKGKAAAAPVVPVAAPAPTVSPALPPPRVYTAEELDAVFTGTAADVPPIVQEMPRDAARLAMVKRERETSVADALWLPKRLDAIDAAIVHPDSALVFTSI